MRIAIVVALATAALVVQTATVSAQCLTKPAKIEASLNFFCSRAGLRQRQTVVYDLGHLIKENKRGLLPGLSGRWDMVREVFLLHWDLYVFETWRSDVAEPEPLPAAEYDLFE